MEINVGDSVYWRIRVGMFPRTLSGIVKEINNGMAKVETHTQNVHGAIRTVNVNILNKKE